MCGASLRSQSPSEVCRRCFETNPSAIWLAWLRCTNTEQHRNKGTVVVVANNKEKKLIKVRPLPPMLTQLNEVTRAPHRDCNFQSCRHAHSEEELLYWKWQVARKSIFMNVCETYNGFHPGCDLTMHYFPPSMVTTLSCVMNTSILVKSLPSLPMPLLSD